MRPAMESEPGERYRNEAMAFAARPDVSYQVQVRHASAETFEEAKRWNEQVRGMVGVAVQNDERDVLFIDHADYGGWVTPGGRVEYGESFRTAAVREVREETGVEARVVQPLLVTHFVNRYGDESTDSYFVLFDGEALDPEPAENPGVDGENIEAVRWRSTVPETLPDDEFVQETIKLVAGHFELQ